MGGTAPTRWPPAVTSVIIVLPKRTLRPFPDTMTLGVKYYSYPDHSGYGLSALAYVRGLHNAGVPVWWAPFVFVDGQPAPWRPEDGLAALPLAQRAGDDAGLEDLPALLAATGPKPFDTVLAHTLPEHWPLLVEPGKRNIGYTVWETDALPAHWPPLLNLPDKVLVPCAMNRTMFPAGGVTRPVEVVPHIRRHAWNVVSAVEGAALRRQLGVADDHFLFYAISVWDPRKALADLVELFSRTFCRDDKVTLVVKTSTTWYAHSRERRVAATIPEYIRVTQDRIAAETGRAPAPVVVLAADGVSGRAIDALHATGDCFVSLTHGEGWGMGAFDAATLGKPVLIARFGGPADYLPAGYPGCIDYTMVPVSGWGPEASFQPPQRWAQPDPVDAGRKLRAMVARYGEFLEPAALAAERIGNRYAEPVVTRELIAAIDG